jgi:hypothetical protein
MSANLISSITQILSSNVIARVASSLGLDKSQVDKALQAGVPGLLAAIISVVSRPGGVSALNGAVAQQQPDLLSNLTKALGSSAEGRIVDDGTSTLNSLLGSSMNSQLSNAVGQYAGLGSNIAKNVMGFLAPVVMGVLGREQRANGLDAYGLADLLESQKDTIARALPAGFSKYLGGTGVLDYLTDDGGLSSASPSTSSSSRGSYTTSSSARYASDPRSSTAQWGWLLPALAVLALIGIVWGMRTGMGPEEAAVTSPPANTERTATTDANPAAPASTGTSTGMAGTDVIPAPFQSLDNLRGIKVGDTDVGAQFASTVNGMRTSLSGIHDAASAQSAVQPLTDSANEFSRLNKLIGQLSPDARKTVVNTVAATRPALDQLIDKVLAIPGASTFIKPTVDSVRSEFDTLSRA